MPSNWLYIDTNFPSFTQKESANDKIETMQDYLFMLVEQLRYTLHNLDLSNMNKAAADGFAKAITDPVYAEIKDAEGNINQIGLTAQGLAARMENAEGNITQLVATADGLGARVSSLDGSVTNLTADVNGIRATVSGKIDGTEAQTLIDQNMNQITLAAVSGSNGTVFMLNKNGVQVASTGTVDLHVKAVNIDGTLTAGKLRGSTVKLIDEVYQMTVGALDLAYTTTGVGVALRTLYGGMQLQAVGNVFLQAINTQTGGASITMDAESRYISFNGNYLILSGNMFGDSPPSGAPFGALYFMPA